ncbi:MAG TPA: hypothetical protein PLK78_13030 [Verrucomicrobiota bacterium]|nr:hypothetical protein [Verrucomicrobiota bacterium]
MNEGRACLAYWVNPNTAVPQDLVFNYTTPFAGYYWIYELANVDLSAPVVTTGPTMTNAQTATLTTVSNNSFVISFYSVNNAATPNTLNTLTPNPPLIQTGTTRGDAPAGASMSSATNTIPLPGLVEISWNAANPPGTANQGMGAIAFVPANIGAPIVAGSVSPPLNAPGAGFVLTVTIDPFHYGTVTNVSVDLSSIGGPAVNALVQTSDPNVWTNSFVVPVSAPLGTATLTVTARQDAEPITGSGPVLINIAEPSAPVLVKDTVPSGFLAIYAGQGITFSAGFSAPGLISYQWQKSADGFTFVDIPGAMNSSYTISSATEDDSGFYRLVASNGSGSAESSPSLLTVIGDVSGRVYTWSEAVPFGGLTAEQILTNFPADYKIAGAMRAQSGSSPTTVILTNADNRAVVFAAPGAWASLSGGGVYLPNVNTNQTGNTSFNAVLNVGYNATTFDPSTITLNGLVTGQKYQVQLFALDNRPGLTPDGSEQISSFQDPTDAYGIASQPFAMADNVYILGTFTAIGPQMVIQQNLPAGAGNFNALVLRSVGWDPPPYFIAQPRNTNNFVGTTVTLSGSAASDTTIANPAINYRWAAGPAGGPYQDLSDGAKYAGTTTSTLTINNLAPSDGNSVYVLKATNGGGTAVSGEARVYVQSLPSPPPPDSYAAALLALTNDPSIRLIGFWPLNETEDPSTGLLIAHDASGNGRSGIYGPTAQNGYNGARSPQPPTFGGFSLNQGALLPTAGDINSVVSLPPLFTTNGIDTTICMWINPAEVPPNLCGLFYTRGAEQCGFTFSGTTDENGLRSLGFFWGNLDGEPTYQFDSGLFPALNRWSFVALVIRSNSATFYLYYVDEGGTAFFGKSVDTAARYTQQIWGSPPIWIGGDSGAVFPGAISSVAMFNSALTDDQLLELFRAGFQVEGFPAGITEQPPASIEQFTGYTLQIPAQTGGTEPVSRQWKFNEVDLVDGWNNGSLIVGATSNILTIYNVTPAWQGVYTLAVTNALGGTISSGVLVTVQDPESPPAANLVGHWFTGTSDLLDHSGNLPGTHNAYGVGANGMNYVFTNNVPPGRSGTSLLLFGGTSMGISNSTIVDPGYVNTFDDVLANGFTVMTWAKGQPNAWNPFVSKQGESEGWQLRRSAGANAVFTLRGTGGPADPAGAGGGSGGDGQWHHYAGTYDLATGTRILYVDGIVQNVTTGDGPYLLSTGARLVLGGRSEPDGSITGTANFTGGQLYDVRIYNTALSHAQIAFVAAPPPPVPPTGGELTIIPPPSSGAGYFDLSWPAGGVLLESTNVIGPWTAIPGAMPPYRVYTTNSLPSFYRVQFP